MKIYFLVIAFLSSNISYSNVLPEICEEFEKYPETFKPIKLDSKGTFAFDIDGDGKKEKCVPQDDGGSCRNTFYSCDGAVDYLNTKSDGYRFGIIETPVEFKGNLYFVLSNLNNGLTNANSITNITKEGKTILCDIVQNVMEVNKVENSHPVCKALADNKIERLSLTDEKVKKDLKRDGSVIKYSEDGFSSGAGCGNSLDSYKAESSIPQNKKFIDAFNSLNSNSSWVEGLSMPLEWSVIRFEKKDYLYLSNDELDKGTEVRYGVKVQPDFVYEWNGTSWNVVCKTTYKMIPKAIKPRT